MNKIFFFLILLGSIAGHSQNTTLYGNVTIDKTPETVIDTTGYKPLLRTTTGGRIVQTNWSEFFAGVTIPTLDQVLTAGNTSQESIFLSTSLETLNYYFSGFSYYHVDNDKYTHVKYIPPIADVTLYFPAKTATDTIATLGDITGISGDFLRLSGTEEGSPVTGDIVLDDGVTILPIENGALNVGSPLNGRMTFADDGQIIVSGPDNPSFVGISGGLDYSANNDGTDRKIYPQTGWVLDRLVNGYISLSGTEPDNPITGSLVFTEGNHIYSEVDINFGSPNYTYLKSQNTDTALIVAAGGDAVNPIGLTGNDDYSANNDGSDRKIYPQTGWVQDAISKLPKIIFNDPVASSSLTGSTTQTILKSYFIPANTIGAGFLDVFAYFNKTGVAGAVTLRFFVNTSNSLSGAAAVGRYTTGATTLGVPFMRKFIMRGGTELIGLDPTVSSSGDAPLTSALVSTSYDVTQGYYFIVAATLANSADSVLMDGFKLNFEKQL